MYERLQQQRAEIIQRIRYEEAEEKALASKKRKAKVKNKNKNIAIHEAKQRAEELQ